jgi:hypothetical protein
MRDHQIFRERQKRALTTAADRAALWADDQAWSMAAPGPPIDDRREAIYEPDRGA